jgi:transcriptional regulator with XRE-family HTH domain
MRGTRGRLPGALDDAVSRAVDELDVPAMLRALRRSRGLKLKEVAERLGVNWQRVAALEEGKRKNTQLRSIVMIALALRARVRIVIEDVPAE